MKKIKHLFLAMMIFAVLGLSYFVTSGFAQNQIQKLTKPNYNKHNGKPSLRIQKGSKGLLKRNDRMEIPGDDERRLGARGLSQRNDGMEIPDDDERRF